MEDRELNLDELEQASGGIDFIKAGEIINEKLSGVFGSRDMSAAARNSVVNSVGAGVGSVACKYCGNMITVNLGGIDGASVKCTCGASYNPSLPDPWSAPKL